MRLETEVTGTRVPPSEPLMQPNPSLPPSNQQELKKARTGYTVDTYRVYLRTASPTGGRSSLPPGTP